MVIENNPVPHNPPVPQEVIDMTKEILEHLHALHLQSIYEMGSIEVIDWVLAEQLMVHFAIVNLAIGEVLNTSLRELVTLTEHACTALLKDIRVALGPTMYNLR